MPLRRGQLLSLGLLPLFAGATSLALIPVSVSGQVTDPAGRPVAGATVTPADGHRLTTGAGGRFSFAVDRWRPGRAHVEAPGFAPATSTGGHVVLHRWPRLAGRALDETGAPVSNAVVQARSGTHDWITQADAQGQFHLSLPGAERAAFLTIEAPRHEPDRHTLALGPDSVSEVAAVLPRYLGLFHLESEPASQPSVDGEPVASCAATPCEIALSAGAHHLALLSELYVPWERDFDLSRGERVEMKAELERKRGTLAVVAPAAGELFLDGDWVAPGSWSGLLPTGRHSLTFRSSATWPAEAFADVRWNQTAPVSLGAATITPGDMRTFQDGLRAYVAASGLAAGVYLEELSSSRSIGAGAEVEMEAASVVKVPVALYLLHQADAKQLKLDDAVELRTEDFLAGTGSLYDSASPSDKRSYQELLALMIQQSDNTAWKALGRVLGRDRIDAFAASLGAPNCHQNGASCTAAEAGHLFTQLARGRVLGPESAQRLLGLLQNTAHNDRINYYLPGVPVAHKVGMDVDVANDCGIVFTASPFVLCMFTEGDYDAGIQAIRDVARAAARLFSR